MTTPWDRERNRINGVLRTFVILLLTIFLKDQYVENGDSFWPVLSVGTIVGIYTILFYDRSKGKRIQRRQGEEVSDAESIHVKQRSKTETQ